MAPVMWTQLPALAAHQLLLLLAVLLGLLQLRQFITPATPGFSAGVLILARRGNRGK